MLRVAICEDKPEQIDRIKSATERYFASINRNADILSYDNPLLFLEDLPNHASFDILLLDICMPGLLGTDVAREIRHRKDKTEIIFLTTSKDFAVEAFTLNAAQYLVKPFTQLDFDGAMNKVLSIIANKEIKPITLKLKGSDLCTIDVNEIAYVECVSHTQTVYLTNGEALDARRTLSELFTALENVAPGQFVSPYKGYIVNQKQIRQITDNQIILQNGNKIPIPKRSSKEISNRYFDWRFEGGAE